MGLFSQGEKFSLHRYAVSLDKHLVVALETSQRKAGAGPEVERLLRRPFLFYQARPPLTRLHDLQTQRSGGGEDMEEERERERERGRERVTELEYPVNCKRSSQNGGRGAETER